MPGVCGGVQRDPHAEHGALDDDEPPGADRPRDPIGNQGAVGWRMLGLVAGGLLCPKLLQTPKVVGAQMHCPAVLACHGLLLSRVRLGRPDLPTALPSRRGQGWSAPADTVTGAATAVWRLGRLSISAP